MKKLALVLGSILGLVASVALVASASVATINAGSDQTITWPTSSVTLTGSATAGDGKSIASYGWVQTSGPVGSTVVSPAVASTSVTGLTTPGTYVYTFTASDNSTPALSTTDTVSVVVNPGITVSAGSNQTITLPTSSATLTGTASTSPGNSIASYSWVQTSGPVSATITSPSSASTGVSGLTVAGSYVFSLTATNNGSPALSASSSMTVTVNPANTVTVSAGIDQSITLPTSTVNLSGTASTTSGSIASYAWVQTSGPTASTIATPSGASTAVSGLTTVGTYVFTLTATNNASPSQSNSDSVSIVVNPAGTTPTPKTIKSKIEIGPNGRVEMKGELLSKGTNILIIKVWGITFTVNTSGARFIGAISDVNQYVVGDVVEIKGTMDTNATTPTVNAKQVKDLTLQAKKEMDWRERIRFEKEKIKELRKEWKEEKKEKKDEWKEEKKEWKQGKKNGWDD